MTIEQEAQQLFKDSTILQLKRYLQNYEEEISDHKRLVIQKAMDLHKKDLLYKLSGGKIIKKDANGTK